MKNQSFLERLAGRKQDRDKSAIAAYRALVRSIANDEEPASDYVEETLEAAGKVISDLQADCEKINRRKRLREIVERRPGLNEERAEIEKEIAAADRELEQAELRHEDVTMPLYSRRHEIDQSLREADNAESKLVQECDDEELNRELAEESSQLQLIASELRNLKEQATYAERLATDEHGRAERQIDDRLKTRYRDKGDAYMKDAKKLRKQVKANEKSYEEGLQRRAEIESRMREW